MRTTILTSALAALIALGGIGFSAPVQAQSIELRLGDDGARVRLRDRDRCDPRFERCLPPPEGRRVDRDFGRGCSEGRALNKAERMGIRRARVVDVGRRTIDVRGRDRFGDRVRVTFGRERGCPVLR